jgi:hypothetical protein
MMTIANKIRKSLENDWIVRFGLDHPKNETCTGVVTALQRDFIVVRQCSDFEFDGHAVLPRRVLSGVRDGDVESCANEIHRHLGSLPGAAAPDWALDCRTFPDILRALQARKIWPAVETIFKGDEDELETAYYLGALVEIRDEDLRMNCYDGSGEWESVYTIGFDEIYKVTFGDRYTRNFNAFMRSRSARRPPGE